MTKYIIQRRMLGEQEQPFSYFSAYSWQGCRADAKQLRYEVAMAKLIELELIEPTYCHEMIAINEDASLKAIESKPKVNKARQPSWQPVFCELTC